jgi:hypothetical protein
MGKNFFETAKKRQHGKHTFIEFNNVSITFIKHVNWKCDDVDFKESVARFKMITDGCYYDKREATFYVVSHIWVCMCLLCVNDVNKSMIVKELNKVQTKLCTPAFHKRKPTEKKPKAVKGKPVYGNMLDKVDVQTISVKESPLLDKLKKDVLKEDFEKEYGLKEDMYKLFTNNADEIMEFDNHIRLREFCTIMFNKYRISSTDIYKCLREKGYLLVKNSQNIFNKKSILDNMGYNEVDSLTNIEYSVLKIKGIAYFLLAMYDDKLLDKRICPKIKN